MSNHKIVHIYTDGAYRTKLGAWAAVLICGDNTKEIYGVQTQTTNNQMEITAAIRALEILKYPCKIKLYTDSQYLRKSMIEWIHKWKLNDWRTTNRKQVANRELLEHLEKLVSKHSVEWLWVRGHNGNPHNERADKLCEFAINQFVSNRK